MGRAPYDDDDDDDYLIALQAQGFKCDAPGCRAAQRHTGGKPKSKEAAFRWARERLVNKG